MDNCKFTSGCQIKLTESTAWCPGLQSLQKAIGGLPEVSDLKKHIFCSRHAHMLRKRNIKMYSYVSTVEQIEKRRRERESEAAAVVQYDTLYLAMQDADVVPKTEPKPKAKRARAAKG